MIMCGACDSYELLSHLVICCRGCSNFTVFIHVPLTLFLTLLSLTEEYKTMKLLVLVLILCGAMIVSANDSANGNEKRIEGTLEKNWILINFGCML